MDKGAWPRAGCLPEEWGREKEREKKTGQASPRLKASPFYNFYSILELCVMLMACGLWPKLRSTQNFTRNIHNYLMCQVVNNR